MGFIVHFNTAENGSLGEKIIKLALGERLTPGWRGERVHYSGTPDYDQQREKKSGEQYSLPRNEDLVDIKNGGGNCHEKL